MTTETTPTTCRKGLHLLIDGNVNTTPSGGQECRACRKASQLAYRKSRKGKAAYRKAERTADAKVAADKKAARAALALLNTPKKVGSHLETLLAAQIDAAGLGPFQTQFKAVTTRQFKFDFAWPEQLLLVEVQGGTWGRGGHSTGTGIARDCEKLALGVLAGYRVIHVTGNQVKDGLAIRWIHALLSEVA